MLAIYTILITWECINRPNTRRYQMIHRLPQRLREMNRCTHILLHVDGSLCLKFMFVAVLVSRRYFLLVALASPGIRLAITTRISSQQKINTVQKNVWICRCVYQCLLLHFHSFIIRFNALWMALCQDIAYNLSHFFGSVLLTDPVKRVCKVRIFSYME